MAAAAIRGMLRSFIGESYFVRERYLAAKIESAGSSTRIEGPKLRDGEGEQLRKEGCRSDEKEDATCEKLGVL
jgi:hypothetical protein